MKRLATVAALGLLAALAATLASFPGRAEAHAKQEIQQGIH